MNLLPARVNHWERTGVQLSLDNGAEIHAAVAGPGAASAPEVMLGIRPEDLLIGPSQANRLSGTVQLVEHLGDQELVYVAWHSDADPLTVRLTGRACPAPGAAVEVSFDPGACHLFNARGDAFPRLATPESTQPP
jgi:multiple sugar transport system ATP-binding protein